MATLKDAEQKVGFAAAGAGVTHPEEEMTGRYFDPLVDLPTDLCIAYIMGWPPFTSDPEDEQPSNQDSRAAPAAPADEPREHS